MVPIPGFNCLLEIEILSCRKNILKCFLKIKEVFIKWKKTWLIFFYFIHRNKWKSDWCEVKIILTFSFEWKTNWKVEFSANLLVLFNFNLIDIEIMSCNRRHFLLSIQLLSLVSTSFFFVFVANLALDYTIENNNNINKKNNHFWKLKDLPVDCWVSSVHNSSIQIFLLYDPPSERVS